MISSQKLQKFAQALCDSIKAQKNDLVMIEAHDRANEIVETVIRELQRREARPLYREINMRISALVDSQITNEQLEVTWASTEPLLSLMHKRIKIIAEDDPTVGRIIGSKQLALISEKISQPSREIIMNKPWILCLWGKESHARMAGMSLAEFQQFNVDSVLIDYDLLNQNAKILGDLIRRTDEVHITGPETDLHFSIKDIGVMDRNANYNLPDGEVFSTPVRESVFGFVKFNIPVYEKGIRFDEIYLRFEAGKVVEARSKTSEQTKRLNEILDVDEGARYTGEFGIGINPVIDRPVGHILFDEKISGSFHIALGSCFPWISNGNNSGLHWDMICLQTPEYGGGEIWFDDVLIRKDGKFIPEVLQSLDDADYSGRKQKEN